MATHSHEIFLSYASADREKARALGTLLENEGFTVFWDRKIQTGKLFDEEIDAALQEAGAVVVLWSAAAVTSRWVKAEAQFAWGRDVLVPAFLEQVKIPVPFGTVQTADLTHWDLYSRSEGVEAILLSLKALLGRQPPAPAPSPIPADRPSAEPEEGPGAARQQPEVESQAEKTDTAGPRTLFLALGGVGTKALLHLRRLIVERWGALDSLSGLSFLSIDTDVRPQPTSALEERLRFAGDEKVAIAVDLKSYADPDSLYRQQIRDWWDEATLHGQTLNLEEGTGQVRPLGRLAFFGSRDKIQEGIRRAYHKVTAAGPPGNRPRAESEIRIVVVAGLGGGTGSGILLDLAALLKEQIGPSETLRLEAFLLLPTGLSESSPQSAANSYAALRELNHYLLHPFKAWQDQPTPIAVHGLYERYVLFSGINAANLHLGDPADAYQAIGESLFLDLGAGAMAGWIRGMRSNRRQDLSHLVTHRYRLERPGGSQLDMHADRWRTAFSSIGISKLALPAWRLLNQARYELAAQMVALLGPASPIAADNRWLSQKMGDLEAEYLHLARLYAAPQRSLLFQEIPLAADLGDLLEPYLGARPEERTARLQRLLDEGLRQMNVATLEQLGERLRVDTTRFRDRLAAHAFQALRGERGRTFIERFSILRYLKEHVNPDKRRALCDALYRKGLPWVPRNDTFVDFAAHGGACLGCDGDPGQDLAEELHRRMSGHAAGEFLPHLVSTSDPSEIVFYTELSGFPAPYLSVLSEMRRSYDSVRLAAESRAPIHLDRDDHQLLPLLPLTQDQLPIYRQAWQLFVQGQMLGLLCSLRLKADDARIGYQWRRKVGTFEARWTDLGTEGQAIERLMLEPEWRHRLQSDIQSAEDRFLATPAGSLYHLIALADYYTHCIFPLRHAPGGGYEISMQNLVCHELRGEWRAQQKDSTAGDPRLEEEVQRVLLDLATWSQPIYRDPRQLVPSTAEVPERARAEEWDLNRYAAEAVGIFIAQGLLTPVRDRLGQPILRFPRLALSRTYFDKTPRGPAAATPWHYHGEAGERQGLSAEQVADLVALHPAGTHRVWSKGMETWRTARDVPEIARLLETQNRKKLPTPTSSADPKV